PGGDFEPTASATTSVGAVGPYTWSSDQLAMDAQHWLDEPGENHGWILIGNETTPSAKKIYSRENPNSSLRPTLTLTYRPGLVLTRRETWEKQFFQIGAFIDPEGD